MIIRVGNLRRAIGIRYVNNNKGLSKKGISRFKSNLNIMIVVALLLLSLFSLYKILTPTITGLVIFDGEEPYLNQTITENTNISLVPKFSGNLTHLSISGKLTGDGTARIYLLTQEDRLLVYEKIGNISAVAMTYPPEKENGTGKINITLDYYEESQWDSDNDGVESVNGVIDFTTAKTAFNIKRAKYEKCTRWEIYSVENETRTYLCNGEDVCCNLVGLEKTALDWNETLNMFIGRYGATKNNVISAQVIALDGQSVEYSNWKNLTARFVGEERLQNECIETCNINIESQNYTLQIELEEAILKIENITYEAAVISEEAVNATLAANVTENITNITLIQNILPIKIVENGSYILNLSEHFSDAERYSFNASNISADFVGDILTLIPDSGFTGTRKGKVVAHAGNESVESKKFNIVVSAAKAAQKRPENITCKEFQDNVLWTSGYSLFPEGSTTYQTWRIGTNCTEAGGSNCFLQNISIKSRSIYLSPYETNVTGEGYIQISDPDEAICDNPDKVNYSRYLAYETLTGEDKRIDWYCGENKNPTAKCGIEIATSYEDNVNCYGIKAYASQYFLVDVFKVRYTWCWDSTYDSKTPKGGKS